LALVAAALLMTSCGGGSNGTEATSQATAEATVPVKRVGGLEVEVVHEDVGNNHVAPHVSIPPGPPPRELVVRELSHISGAKAESGDLVGVQYVELDWASGKRLALRWGPSHLYRFRWGTKRVPRSWTIGLQGMEVGDRRELRVPASLTGGKGPQLYVVELIEVRPR
jgi:peptidylprolyl isomerase